MQKFFRSGAAFVLLALLCVAVGLISKNGAVFTIVGAFWLVMAIIVRRNNAKKPPSEGDS